MGQLVIFELCFKATAVCRGDALVVGATVRVDLFPSLADQAHEILHGSARILLGELEPGVVGCTHFRQKERYKQRQMDTETMAEINRDDETETDTRVEQVVRRQASDKTGCARTNKKTCTIDRSAHQRQDMLSWPALAGSDRPAACGCQQQPPAWP
jgi:hypothetical protein